MKLNKHNFKEYGARVLKWGYQPLSITRENFQPDNSLLPILGIKYPKPKPMELVVEFSQQRLMSDFIAEILKNDMNLLDLDDGYIYKCWMPTLNNPVEEPAWGWYSVTIPFLVIQTAAERAISLKKLKNDVIVQGNWECECRYEITLKSNETSFTVDGIIVKDIRANQKLVIDGAEKRIYTGDSVNKYSDAILRNNRFPVLSPGPQSIQISSTAHDVWLYYQPIYV